VPRVYERVNPDLDAARRAFRESLAQEDAAGVLRGFAGRIGVVLSGGGARGAYEAGALLAFQDAGVPTHIITATSVGAVNAASYAAHAEGLVGNAEPLLGVWTRLSPRTLGIEWTRYGWMVAGLIATSAGVGNLAWYLLTLTGFDVRLRYPALAWSALALAGLSVLLFYPQLPYLWFLVRTRLKGKLLEPVRRRLAVSIFANLLVGGFLVAVVMSLSLASAFHTLVTRHPFTIIGVLAALLLLRQVQHRHAARISGTWERLFRVVLQPGLFKNFERVRFLRRHVPADGLRRSPMRLLFAATDLIAGTARYFTNTDPETLAGDPGVDRAFVRDRVTRPDDLVAAIAASSALPITYEPVHLEGRTLMDGAVMGSQPIRPALRLGADVLFLVLMQPESGPVDAGGSFMDVGTRTLGILMHQHLRADLRELTDVNALCEGAAHQLRVPPEAVIIELGTRRMQYVRTFVVRPARPLGLGMHDFGGPATPDAIAAGYRDTAEQLRAFLRYARTARFDHQRRILRLMPSDLPALQAGMRRLSGEY
jgi:predicted acylesterase/phospholipase RssA